MSLSRRSRRPEWLGKPVLLGKSRRSRGPRVDGRRRRLTGERLERRDLLAGVSLTVTTLADLVAADETLSLREAIELANAGGDAEQAFGRALTLAEQSSVSGEIPFGDDVRIGFDSALFGEAASVLEIARQLEIRSDMRIEGPGRDQLVIDAGASDEVVLSPEFTFDFTVIASDLSPNLRLFGSPNPADAPFTILRYGRGTVIGASDLPWVSRLISFEEELEFTFGSNDPSNPVEVATLSSFNDGLSDGVARQVYTPDNDDDPAVIVSIGGEPFATGELLEVRLEVTPGSPPSTVSSESDPSRMRLTSLIDEQASVLWDELMVATDGTGVLPFSLSEFSHDGSPIGFGDAARFDSFGTTKLDPLVGSRVFDVQGTEDDLIDVVLTGMTLRGGALPGSPSPSDGERLNGGGLRSQDANLNLSGVRITENRAYQGGGIHASRGTLVVSDSEMVGNHASANGSGGGILLDSVDASITRSPFSGNTAGTGGAILNLSGSVLTVRDSTFHNNAATGTGFGGGAISNFGQNTAGLSSATLINVTMSSNRASSGGGIWNGFAGQLHVINSTIVSNSHLNADHNDVGVVSGGIYTFERGGIDGTTTLLENTIVAGNTGVSIDGTVVPADLIGSVAPQSSHNLIGDPESAGGLTNGIQGNRVGDPAGSGVLPLDVILDPELGDNGGGVLTHMLIEGSPAVDAGSDELAVVPGDPPVTIAYDQRGVGFDRIVAASVDIGAVERVANVRGWQNPVDRFDVNNRDGVSGLDALLIINFLNRAGGEFDLTLTEPDPDDLYYDVSGDDRVTALDALLVINELARRMQGGGESESTPLWGLVPSTLSSDDDDDDRVERLVDSVLTVWDG